MQIAAHTKKKEEVENERASKFFSSESSILREEIKSERERVSPPSSFSPTEYVPSLKESGHLNKNLLK
jgi:hypothetical protein